MLVVGPSAMSQTKKVSDNKKPEFSKNYFQKENSQDTTYVVLDFKRGKLEIREGIENAGNYEFCKIRFTMGYPTPESPNTLVYFAHFAGPPFGHEVYSINKCSIPKDKLILESDKNPKFWYHNYLKLEDSIVILIDLNDWKSKGGWVKGIGVQVGINLTE